MKLPPLNAVRAFDAAARHLNLRRAAGDLFVTPGAISQQVRQLEDWLGVRLFDRRARGVELTEAGAQFHAAVARSLRQIALAADRVRPERNAVTISVLPSLGSSWLVPRLDGFTRVHPLVQVRVDATMDLPELGDGDVDLALWTFGSPPPGLAATELCPELLYPLCTAEYRAEHAPQGRPRPSLRLLHELCSREPNDYWQRWLAEQGCDDIDPAHGLYFSHEMLAADAAARGQGVALVGHLLAADWIRRGELVLLAAQPLVTGKRIFVVSAPGGLREPVRRFHDWLLAAFGEALADAPAVLAAAAPR